MGHAKEQKRQTEGFIRTGLAAAGIVLMALAGTALAQQPISVAIEAIPSPDCLPASALQAAELVVDFSRACPDCRVLETAEISAQYRVVVEDPFFSWSVKVFDRDGKLIHRHEWSGGLDLGLKETARFLRNHRENLLAMEETDESSQSPIQFPGK